MIHLKGIKITPSYTISIPRKTKQLPKLFCWVGGKNFMVNRLLRIIPPHTIYIEPFVGGGSVYFAKEPAYLEVISDIDPNVINLYKSLKDYSIIYKYNRCVDYCNLSESKLVNLCKLIYEKKIKQDKLLNPCELLVYISAVYGGDLYKEPQKRISTKAINKIRHIPSILDKYCARLQNTVVLCSDYRPVILRYDKPQAFIYLDPPYIVKQNFYRTGDWTLNQFKELLDLLVRVKGKFLLNINTIPEILELLRRYSFYVYIIRVPYFINGKKQEAYDLVITNYKIEQLDKGNIRIKP